jgi:AcrR family transcriptional regulator
MSSGTAAARRATPLPAGARRAAIIEAIVPLLVEHGKSVTTRQLAQAAGVSEGTLFNVFSDKDELLSAALAAALDAGPFERAINEIDATLPFEQRVVEATRIVQHRIVAIWHLVSSIGYGYERLDGPLPDSPALTALFAGERDHLRLEPVEAARLLRALAVALTHPKLTPAPMSAERIVEVLLHGMERAPA